jgi:hypothetical protein
VYVCLHLYLVLFVFLGQGVQVPGNPHDNGGSLQRRQEWDEPGDEALSLTHRHDQQTLLVTHSAGWGQLEEKESESVVNINDGGMCKVEIKIMGCKGAK